MMIRSTTSPLALMFVLSLVGCDKKDTATTPAPSAKPSAGAVTPQPSAPGPQASAASSASARPATRDRSLRFGASGMLLTAARNVDLKEPQKAKLTAIEDKLRDNGPPTTEHKELETDLAAQIRAGKIDAAKLKPRQDAVDKLADAKHDRDMEAVTSLHAALEPAQRKAVTAAVRARQVERDQRMAKRKDKDDDKLDPAARLKARTERMTRTLSLDDAQQKTFDAALKASKAPTPEEMTAEAKKRTEALLALFEQDTLDPKKLAELKPKKHSLSRHGLEPEILTKLVPALKPEQREKLAAMLEDQGANGKRRHGRPGPGGPGGPGGPDSDDDD